MYVSAVYQTPKFDDYILVMPEGSVFLCPSTLRRKVTVADLTPVDMGTCASVAEWLELEKAIELDLYDTKTMFIFKPLAIATHPIRAARLELGLSQSELARLVGISKRRIMVIQGKDFDLGTVRAKNALEIASVLGLDPHVFLQKTNGLPD